MKKEIEHSIKESIEGFEMPYDSQAWDRLKTTLDELKPTTPKIKTYKRLTISIAIIGSLVGIGYVYVNTVIEKAAKSTIHKSLHTHFNSSHSKKEYPRERAQASHQTTYVSVNKHNTIIQPKKENVNTLKIHSQHEIDVAVALFAASNMQELTKNNKSEISLNSKFNVPSVSDICLGETVTINNANEDGFQIQLNGEKVTAIRSKQTANFKPTQEGSYTINYSLNGTNQSEVLFNVLSVPTADFIVNEQNNFENGVPTIELNALGFGSTFTWTIEGQNGLDHGKETHVHLFKKGNYSIALVVQGANGCQSKEIKTIQIDEEYNLLAVNTFDPNTSDNKRNNFMPYALTQRETDFILTIIDPKDGSVIFESNDATNPWKGIDSRTNQLVNSGTYIWKVIIKSPLKGEKSTYQGTITRL